MARVSRADRKRINARASQTSAPYIPETVETEIAAAAESTVSVPTESKLLRTTRRPSRADQPVDYTAEYAVIAHDLRRIGFWGALLIVAVVALGYSGLV
jgi:hypothetical protein